MESGSVLRRIKMDFELDVYFDEKMQPVVGLRYQDQILVAERAGGKWTVYEEALFDAYMELNPC